MRSAPGATVVQEAGAGAEDAGATEARTSINTQFTR